MKHATRNTTKHQRLAAIVYAAFCVALAGGGLAVVLIICFFGSI